MSKLARCQVRRRAQRGQLRTLYLEGFDAVGADCPYQTLGDNTDHRGLNQKERDSQVQKTGYGGRRVVGVQSGKDQMPCQGGLDGILGGLQVSQLPDHDDIRILSQNISEDGAESDPYGRLNSDLVELFMNHFNRILHGRNIDAGRRQVPQCGIEGR